MAKKEHSPTSEQVNIRIPVYFLEWMEAFKAAQPYRLTKTQLFEAALSEWLVRHAEEYKPKPAKKPKP